MLFTFAHLKSLVVSLIMSAYNGYNGSLNLTGKRGDAKATHYCLQSFKDICTQNNSYQEPG